MTATGYTHISILLDESGSMIHIAPDVLKGFNAFINAQKEVEGYCTVTMAKFSNKFSYLNLMNSLNQIPELSALNYFPSGGTALFASQMKLIEDTGMILSRLPEDARPSKVLMLTISDGEENMSPHISWFRPISEYELKTSIKHQEDVYNWESVYLGTSEQGVREAIRTGYSNTVKFNSSNVGETFSRMSASTRLYRVDSDYEKGSFAKNFENPDSSKEIEES